MVNTAHKGRRAEHRAQRILEAAGYTTTRAAGSKGAADLIAWNGQTVRFIQVKAGQRGCGPLEREALRSMAKPGNATVEVWRFLDRCREPMIEVL